MKKLFSAILAIMTMFASFGFVSCVSETDELVPEKKEPQIKVYYGYVSGHCLDYMDVSLTLHSGSKTKTVTLKKEDGVKNVASVHIGTQRIDPTDVLGYLYAGFDGAEGIDKVEANVVLKADAIDRLSATNPETTLSFVAGAYVSHQPSRADGKYETPQDPEIQFHAGFDPAACIMPATLGGVAYDHLIESIPGRIKSALEVK